MSDLATINYQPLANMQRAFAVVFKRSLQESAGKAMLVLSAGVLPILGLIFGSGVGGLILGVMVYFAFLYNRDQKYEKSLWIDFAQVNGWTIDSTTPVEELIPPSMQFGHSRKFSPIIQAQLDQFNCQLFSYNTTVGGGKSSRTYSYAVVRLQLPTSLPHMLLLSQKGTAVLGRDLANRQDVQLEGNFNDYFKLQIEQGQQIDALTVITPDVMQTLVQSNQQEDIEVLGDELYFIMGLSFGQDNPDLSRVQYLVRSAVALSTQVFQSLSLERGPAAATQPNLV